jgi:hypothetical protein
MNHDQTMTMLGVNYLNYRWSPIMIHQVTKAEPVNSYRALDKSTLVAGDRAPDAPSLRLTVVKAGAQVAAHDYRTTYKKQFKLHVG